MKRARRDWHHSIKRGKTKGLIFIDETCFSTAMTKPRGYAPRGKRPRAPHGHWKTTTSVGGPNKTGSVAPMLHDGPINGDSSKAYAEQVLAPVARQGPSAASGELSDNSLSGSRRKNAGMTSGIEDTKLVCLKYALKGIFQYWLECKQIHRGNPSATGCPDHWSLISEGASVLDWMNLIASRTALAFCSPRFLGKSFSSFSKYWAILSNSGTNAFP